VKRTVLSIARSRGWRALVPAALLALAVSLIWWRGPDWRVVRDAFTVVQWDWIVAAVAMNLLSVLLRSLAWNTAIGQALTPPHPRFRSVFAAFCVGLFANVVLPGRVGELARVAVLARRMPGRRGVWLNLIGSVFAHRVFDLFPVLVLVVWVLSSAKLPHWAVTSSIAVLGIGFALFAFAILTARRNTGTQHDGISRIQTLVNRAREGLGVMRAPVPAAICATFQFGGWACQLLAVWMTMVAFHIHLPLVAAGLVLLVMNVATVFPLWPGNVGLLQAAIAIALEPYGVSYADGFAFGIGLQAMEASVGVGLGMVFLTREGFSDATLRDMPEAPAVVENAELLESIDEPENARAGVSG
jgi:uncharacterized protein (TIRG00374 family)